MSKISSFIIYRSSFRSCIIIFSFKVGRKRWRLPREDFFHEYSIGVGAVGEFDVAS
jgi:hypothetical protein